MRALPLMLTLFLAAPAMPASAQQDPKAIVARAVATELQSDHDDHTAFVYRDHDVTPDHDIITEVIETPQGSVKRMIEDRGKPVTPAEREADEERNRTLLNDKDAQAKARRDARHDDEQAEEMLRLLPTAFLWTVKAETPQTITLEFKPDPAFNPDGMEARVLSSMAGEIVVQREQDRIQTIRGTLVSDVKIAFGILGRLKEGGTFEVERREVVPHHWQVTESRVHIEGKVFFKTIGSQEDESRSDFRVSHSATLQDAFAILEAAGK